MTNREYLTCLSDKELAKLLASRADRCKYCKWLCTPHGSWTICEEGIEAWLKEEKKDNDRFR